MELKTTGRVIDTTCPSSGECFANQGCGYSSCPQNGMHVLLRIGELEHELEFFPHNDPEVAELCRRCRDKEQLGVDESTFARALRAMRAYALSPNEFRGKWIHDEPQPMEVEVKRDSMLRPVFPDDFESVPYL